MINFGQFQGTIFYDLRNTWVSFEDWIGIIVRFLAIRTSEANCCEEFLGPWLVFVTFSKIDSDGATQFSHLGRDLFSFFTSRRHGRI